MESLHELEQLEQNDSIRISSHYIKNGIVEKQQNKNERL